MICIFNCNASYLKGHDASGVDGESLAVVGWVEVVRECSGVSHVLVCAREARAERH